MDYRYKVIINNRTVYKEIELLEEMEEIRIGTTTRCEFRLNPDNFFSDIELILEKRNGKWSVTCGDSLYISVGDMRKLMSIELVHGSVVSLCYGQSGDEAFKLHFQIDFEAQKTDFNWYMSIANRDSLIIGNRGDEDIIIGNTFEKNCRATLVKSSKGWMLEPNSVEYGVYINGKRINEKTLIKDYSFFLVGGVSFYYRDNLVFLDKNFVERSSIEFKEVEQRVNSFNYPLFNRNTRVKHLISNETITILDPPAMPQKPKDNILMSLLPALAMLALTIVVRGFMSNSSNKSFIIFSVCSMSMGIITSIFSFFHGKKQYKVDLKERVVGYSDYIETKKAEVANARQEELEALRSQYRSVEDDIRVALTFDADLFDRTTGDEDFLEAYLGTGRVKSKRQLDWKYKEALEVGDELSQIPEQLYKDFEYIENAPITIPLKDANAVGIIGTPDETYNLSKNILLDLAIRHYQGDVRIFTMVADDDNRFEWVRQLPHVDNETGRRNIVCDVESKNIIFEGLYKELSARANAGKDAVFGDFLVIFVSDEHGIKNHPVSKFIGQAAALNALFIFLEERVEDIPLSCSYMIKLDGNSGELYASEDGAKTTKFKFNPVSDEAARDVAQKLSPVYCEEISLESSLRKNISFYELLQIYSANDIDLAKRWNESKIYESMAAPLGVNVKDEIIYLDLHEKFHGPHGLVAGTTGSGKSEILQSYIISAATLFHPYELGFVIIDFKGGGMVNQFRDLPHLIGAITNIDGREIDRSLKSIKAELLKRQSLFAEANVNHIDKYIKAFKEGKASTPLPHLVIIVDEFAELKAEQPEFMKELISAARIGRSLGVHLILATQKPAGQVNEQIWSNSKFKLCLKVQDESDSKEVLKSPLAAEIREPGRAYLQVGNNEIFELFQSAYSGGPAVVEDTSNEKNYRIFEKAFSGKMSLVFEQKAQKTKNAGKTELDAVVDYIHEYCDNRHITKLPNICLPSLEDVIDYEAATSQLEMPQMEVAVGTYDDPDNQYQGQMVIDFGHANTMIIGSSQMGKTNLLQLMIRALVDQNAPEDLQMYILDFGSMILKNFEGLKHVGGVVIPSEDERVKNFFKLMMQEIEIRKQKLLKAGVSSYVAYCEAGRKDMPKVFVFIDNYMAFKELYMDAYEPQFTILTRDGVSLGINVIVTNNTANGFGYRQTANFPNHVALTCAEKGEYSNLLERCKMEPKNVPGRALVLMDKVVYEVQTYIAFAGEKEFERANAMRDFVEKANTKYASSINAKEIPSIPDTLTRSGFIKEFMATITKRFIPYGLDFATIDPIGIDMADEFELPIVGKRKEQVISVADTIIKSAQLNNQENGVELYIFDDFERRLAGYKELETTTYTLDTESVEAMLTEVLEKLKAKKQKVIAGGKLDNEPLQMIVFNNKEIVEGICANKAVLGIYNEIVKNYKTFGILTLYTCIDDAPIPFAAPELFKKIKEGKRGIVLDNMNQIKVFEVGFGLTKKFIKKLEDDEAYYFSDAGVSKVKLITED